MIDQVHYLDTYKELNEPKFAVLVKGEWGVGKTYQVKKKLAEKERYYVSLFGLSHSQQVFTALLNQISGGSKHLMNALKVLPDAKFSFFGVSIAIPASLVESKTRKTVLSNFVKSKVIVFDDLERSSIPFKELWGLINQFVEHAQGKVVIICHDDIMGDCFKSQKEKIIGYEIVVQPQSDATSHIFDAVIKDEHKASLEPLKGIVIDTFNKSCVKSLRVLEHCLKDVIWLYNCLEEKHVKEKVKFQQLIAYFVAFSLAFRNNDLSKENLTNRETGTLAYKDGDNENLKLSLEEFYQRHPDILPYRLLLSDKILIQTLVQGVFCKEKIVTYLSEALYFLPFEEWPAWYKVWNFDKLEDCQVAAAISEMKRQFDDRFVTDFGELLHIFALRLLLADVGEVNEDLQTVTNGCTQYLDDLFVQDPSKFRGPKDYEYGNSGQLHGGYELHLTSETKPFMEEITNHLNAKHGEALSAIQPERVKELLRLMKEDVEKFHACVVRPNQGVDDFGLALVFNKDDATKFVNHWMQAPRQNWAKIMRAFKDRYRIRDQQGKHYDDSDFFPQLLSELDRRANQASGIPAYRIRRHRSGIESPNTNED